MHLSRTDGSRLLAKTITKKRRTKYGNKKHLGFDEAGRRIQTDSGLNARRWAELRLLQKRGEIRDLERQIVYDFPMGRDREAIRYVDSNRRLTYVLDFRYTTRAGMLMHEDAKGVRT